MIIWTRAPVTSAGGSTDTSPFDTTSNSHGSLCCLYATCRVAVKVAAQLDVLHHMKGVSAAATKDLKLSKLPTPASSSNFAHLSIFPQHVASQGGQVDQQNKQTQVCKRLISKSVDLVPTRLRFPAAIVERRINRAKISQPQKGLLCLHI